MLKPVGVFQDMTVMKGKNGVEFKTGSNGEYVTFIARESLSSPTDIPVCHSFIAFGDTCQKIKKMKIKPGSKLLLNTKIKKYLNNSKSEYIFDIIDLSFSESAFTVEKEKTECKHASTTDEQKAPAPKATFDAFEQSYQESLKGGI